MTDNPTAIALDFALAAIRAASSDLARLLDESAAREEIIAVVRNVEFELADAEQTILCWLSAAERETARLECPADRQRDAA